MMTGWSLTRLGDVIHIKHGFAFSGMAEDPDFTLPVVVAIGNFDYAGGFRFDSTTVKRYQGDYPAEYKMKPGEVLLAMTCQTTGGEILGIPGTIPDNNQTYLHNQRLGKVEVIDPERICLPFVFHLTRWKLFNHYLFATASGSKILHTSPGRIEAFELELPPLTEQRSIAATLGALDEKIGSNRRARLLLRELGGALFRRSIARASTTVPLESLTKSIARGVSPGYADDDLSAPIVINQKCIRDGWVSLSAARRMHAREVTPKRLAVGGDILVNSTGTGTLGRIARWHEGEVLVDSHVSVVKPDASKVNSAVLAYALLGREADVEELATGSTGQTELSPTRLGLLPVTVPTSDARRLADQLLAIECRSEQLASEILKLTALRDTLLPELLSGRLRVPTAEVAA